MKNTRRWLAGILAVVMVLNSSLGSVWAAENGNVGNSIEVAGAGSEAEEESESAVSVESAENAESAENTENTENAETGSVTGDEEKQGNSALKDEKEEDPGNESEILEREKTNTEVSESNNFIDEEQKGQETVDIPKDEENKNESTDQNIETEVANEGRLPLALSRMQSVTSSFDSMCNDIFGNDYSTIGGSEEYAEVYVGKNSGSEQTGELGDPTKPYGSLRDAYTALALNNKKGAIVHLMESYSEVGEKIDTWPESAVPVIVVSDAYEKAMLSMDGEQWDFQANVGFYNVKIALTYPENTAVKIYANGYNIVFGGYGENNFAFFNENDSRNYPTLFGASSAEKGTAANHSSVENSCIKVYGGIWSQIFGGGEYYSDVNGQASVYISGYIASTGSTGAVTFSKKNTIYMEGSSYVYGGGAGVLQNIPAEEDFSHCGSTMVDMEYVTLDKSITPNGGYVEEKAELNLRNSTVKGFVHVYSEGRPAKEDVFNIENTTIVKLGSFGSNSGEVAQKYRIARAEGLEKLTFYLNNTTVTDQFVVRSGLLAEGKYNDVQETNVKICNSDLVRFWVGAGGTTDQRNDKQNELLNLWIENSNIRTKMTSFYGFCKIGQMTLIGMGTTESPFEIEKNTFGSYSNNREIKNLNLEQSVVAFGDSYTVETVDLKNSTIRMKNQELNVTNVRLNDAENTLCFTNDTFINVYGNIEGTGTEIDFSELNEEGKRAGVWKKGGNDGSDHFQIKQAEGVVSKHDANTKMEYWYGYFGEKKEQTWIYLDGKNGDDTYDGKRISTAVKSMDRALEIIHADSKMDTIVLCDAYEVAASASYEGTWLVSKDKGTKQTVTITMQDDMMNYKTMKAGIHFTYPEFTGNAVFSYVNFGSSFLFKNIDFYNDRPGQYPGILCNGYDTFIEEGVRTIISTEQGKGNGVISIYSGNADKTADCSKLSIQSGNWGWIYLGGVTKNAQTGSYENKSGTLKFTNNALNQGIGINGSIYGNVEIQCLGNTANLFCGTARFAPGTVYGNIDIDYQDGEGGRCVAPCPAKIIVEGNVTFKATNPSTGYHICSVSDCTVTGNLVMELNNPKGSMDPGTDQYRHGYGCWILSENTNVGGKLTWKINMANVQKIGMSGKNEWVKNGGNVDVTLDHINLNRIFASNENALSGTSMEENPYADCNNMKFTVKGGNSTLNECNGIGNFIVDDAVLEINTKVSMKKVEAIHSSYLKMNEELVIGTKKDGELTVLSGSTLEVKGGLKVDGLLKGAEDHSEKGTIINNSGDENGIVQMTEVTGNVTGQTYYYTSFDEAKIKVDEFSDGEEIQALPPDENGYTYTGILAEPDEESGKIQGRIWTVTNLKSRKYVYVNGNYSSLTDEEYAKHDGTTPELAYKTIKEAYDVVLSKGYIILCGDTEVSEWPSNATIEVTITSKLDLGDDVTVDYYTDEAERAKLVVNGNLSMLRKTKFDNICFYLPSQHSIKSNGYSLTLGHAHTDEMPSIIVEGNDLNIWGANADRQVRLKVEPEVAIYDGTYGIVTPYSYDQTNIINCDNGKLNIYGGSVKRVYAIGGLTDVLSEKSVTNVYLENAEIREGIFASFKPQYAQGTINIKLGEKMSFGETGGVYLGNFDYYTFSGLKDENINFSIDNQGEIYRIPQIYCGSYYKAANVNTNNRDQFINLDLSNVDIDSLYCGPSVDIDFSSTRSCVFAKLGNNTKVKDLYYGSVVNDCIPNVCVTIASDSAKVEHLCTTSERESAVPKGNSQLILENVGTDQKNYAIPEAWEMKGLTELSIKNSVIDVTNIQQIDTKILELKNNSKLYGQNYELYVTGNYISDGTAEWHLGNAPQITFGGNVSGKTKLISADPDAGADYEVTGRFYNGITIQTQHDENHSKENFEDYQNKPLEFQNSENQDKWFLSDLGDTEERTQIYVSAKRGSDSNSGTYGRPVQTIKEAYDRAEEFYKNNTEKTKLDIILLSDVVLPNENMPEYMQKYEVTIRSNDASKMYALILNDQNREFTFPTDTTLECVKIENEMQTVSGELYADGHRVEIKDTVVTSATSGYYPIIYGGGKKEQEYEKTNLIINGGTWNAIYGGCNKKESYIKSVQLSIGGKTDTKNIGTTSELTTGIFGGSANGTVDNVVLNIEGGTYFRIFGGGNSANAPVTGTVQIQFKNGTVQRLYGGGQYAQAGDIEVYIGEKNTDVDAVPAKITEIYRGSGLYAGIANGKTAKTYLKNNALISSEQKRKEIQFAAGGYAGDTDNTEIYIEGGTIESDLYGGGWGEGTPGNYGNVNKTQIQITGGNIYGNIYGGGNLGIVKSKTAVIVNGGKIIGNVYGGGNAAGVKTAVISVNCEEEIEGNIYGGSYAVVDENGNIQESSFVELENAKIIGAVFAGSDTGGLIKDTAKVEVSGSANVSQGIYGGGSKAALKIQPQVTIAETATLTGNIFGGGKGELKSTNRLARAFYSIFTDSDLIDANVPSTNVTINGTVNGDVFAGGEYATVGTTDTNATSETLAQAVSCVTINGTVNGKVYGGGKGEKGKEYAAVNGSTKVTLGAGGNIVVAGNKEDAATGIVFGGGQNAPVAGNTTVEVQDGTYSAIFGGNDVSGTIQGAAKVTVTGGRTEHVYGAGRDAAYEGSGASVEINVSKQGTDTAANTENAANAGNTASTGNTANTENAENTQDTQNAQNTSSAELTASEVYGGGYGESATTNKASVTIRNGQVTTAYAGGNAASTKSAEISVTGGAVDTVFGGGNAATITDTSTITVNTTDDTQHVETVFAGNNQAAMAIKPTLDLQDGKIGTLYCGGNQGVMTYHGDANHGIQYSFAYPKTEIDTVYAGCNNTTNQTANVELTLVSGTYGTVYGGNNQNGAMAQTGVIVDGSADTAADLPENAGNVGTLQVTTIYGGGNQADAENTNVTVKNGKVTTIYGGGNQASAKNAAVNVENGQIAAVYGGGNAATVTKSVTITTGAGETENTTSSEQITIADLYCGNNEAEMAIAPIIHLQKGTITNFYGGGNKGAMTCEQGISYTFDSADLTVDTMYGGGNEAGVTTKTALLVKAGNYTTIYGGSNSRGTVEETEVTIAGNVGKTGSAGTLTGKIFGGGRGEETTVHTANVNLQNGKIAGNVYGGSGFGTVKTANVTVKENTENSGSDNTSNSTFGSNSDNTSNSSSGGTSNRNSNSAKVQIAGNVFGAGYGVSSSVEKTNVIVDLNLSIATEENGDGDIQVTETAKAAEDKSGESLAKAEWKNNKNYTDGSYIAGNVFGGGDMGQVGKGYINNSTNTAVIEQNGTTSVTISGGYIHGNVFGGGNGQPGGKDENGTAITEYTVYMGTVFGISSVIMNGGYVNGSVFGCGQQSRTYAAEDQNGDGAKDASFVLLATDGNLAIDGNTATGGDTTAEAESTIQKPVLIGGSIFGGGNKGNGTVQNASVATTYGDTHVTLRGKEKQNTPIYLLSNANGTAGGGVYGDGNLCLVSGKKYVTLQNFSCGTRDKASLLKTFYSLQRADVVDLIGSRIVLKGAVDLVAENADDTLYSINRVSQLNLKQNSTIKVTKTVNLLGELTSDEQQNRQFIDRGNNTGNASITGNEYTASGGGTPENPLKETEVTNYINAYEAYAKGGITNSIYSSINVVCVANGGYLEIKKSAAEYGPVTGLFTLQLVNANPGEGGGFVYADIMGKKMTGSDGQEKYITGNFVCVTKQAENADDYMYAYHNVGGRVAADGRYEYYVWYLKGNKYNYDVDLTAYIGTKDTDFTRNISLALEPNQVFILTELNQSKNVNGVTLETMYQNTWDASSDTDKTSDKFAVEVTLLKNEKSSTGLISTETSIGYLGYQTENDTDPKAAIHKDGSGNLIWGIWRKTGTENGSWKFQACKGNNNSFQVTNGDALAEIGTDVVSAQLKFTLHKGTGMTTEFKNLPLEMKLVEVGKNTYESALSKTDSSIETDSCIRLNTNLNLSAIRLVPTQAAYIGSGRMFAGVSSSSNVNITETSAFTAQFVTKYIPSAFNTGTESKITETLVTGYDDIYLLDPNGVGYTIQEDADGNITLLNLTNTSNPEVKKYQITKRAEGEYQVSYLGDDTLSDETQDNVMKDADGNEMVYSCTMTRKSSGFTLPKGTMITLLASLDENDPTYWYYYCTEEKTEVSLGDFRKMNTSNQGASSGNADGENTSGENTSNGNSANYSGTAQNQESVYDTIFTNSSSRVTENMIFVFDFSEVAAGDWQEVSQAAGQNQPEGAVMLRHTYKGAVYQADIMDYVSTESQTSQEGAVTVTYARETPKQTEPFKISKDSDGIAQFTVTNGDSNTTYGQKDRMKFNLNIEPDTTVTNTQYEEREYAVILTLRKKGTSGTTGGGITGTETTEAVPFPEGTVFIFRGKKLVAGKDNRYVTVPVETVGTHEVEIESGLYGFDPGEYDLEAKLYSTTEEGYFNSIQVSNNTQDKTSAAFTIQADPVYALGVTEESDANGGEDTQKEKRVKNHLVQAGESFRFAVKAAGGETADLVSVKLYQYEKSSGVYRSTALEQVFEQKPNLTTTGESTPQQWTPEITANAPNGTYRLEFTYHNKTEYWDFIITG